MLSRKTFVGTPMRQGVGAVVVRSGGHVRYKSFEYGERPLEQAPITAAIRGIRKDQGVEPASA